MKKKLLILFSLLSIVALFVVTPKITRAEVSESYTYTNIINSKAYSYPNTILISSWANYIDHVNYSSIYDLNVGYTINFTPDDITFKIDSIYINNVNFSTYTRYYNAWDNTTKLFSNYQLNINGQPPLSVLKSVSGSSRYGRDMHYLFYIDSSPTRYYFGFSINAVLDYLKPLTYSQTVFTDQYRSNNRFNINLGSNDTDDYYFSWIIPRPIGNGYNVPTFLIDLQEEENLLNAYNNGKNTVIESPNSYGLYSSEQYSSYGELRYNTGKDYGINIGKASQNTFLTFFAAVFDAPLQFFNGLFDFNLLGYDLKPLVVTLLSLSIVLGVMRFIASVFRGN